MTPYAKSELVKDLALQVGFDRVGVTHAGPISRAAYYRQWLAAGHAGSMTYLARNVPTRCEPARLLPDARSIICVALNYRRAEPTAEPVASRSAGSGFGESPGSASPTGRVAQYARGTDYHVVVGRMLDALIAAMRESLVEPFDARALVDAAPALERELAARAGLGWIAKNTMLLNHELGSFTFLGEIVTTLELAPDEAIPDHCGTCTRCLEACPTHALHAPYQMDARLCISYLTIEHRDDIPEELHAPIGDWVYGCDVCQDVCPYNRRAPAATNPDVAADRIPARLELRPLTELRAGAYRRLTRDTAARRASLRMWRRNAAIALRNS